MSNQLFISPQSGDSGPNLPEGAIEWIDKRSDGTKLAVR